jgi:MoaA/NifB/PqqE/SkfB family radical SAM enzyme
VISGNTDIANELAWVQQHHSTDQTTIGHHWVDIPYSKNPISDVFCMAPWTQLHLNTAGEVLPCCLADTALPFGDLKTQNLDDIANGPRMNQLRMNMLTGCPSQECSKCYELEKNKFQSQRQTENQRWSHLRDKLIDQTNDNGSLKEFNPVYLDLRFNNICNLKCRTCSGHYSSQIAHEEKKLFNNSQNVDTILTTKQRNHIFNKTVKAVDTAKRIYFAGGEPLLMKEHYDILDHLIQTGNTDLEIFYNTNFTTLQYKDKNVLEYWKNFSNITIGASIDGYGSVFEYVRHGAIWKNIEQNLQDLKQHCPTINFTVESTMSLISTESVMELQKNWHTQGKLNIDKFFIKPMIGSYLSLQMLRPWHKTELNKKIDDHCNWLNSINAVSLHNKWMDLKKFMFENDLTYVINQYSAVNSARDLERGENFKSVFPQYHDLF